MPLSHPIALALSAALLTSCTTTLEVDYRFGVVVPEGLAPSAEDDAAFDFDFVVVPTGIYFTVQNNSSAPATIDWQNCFFIDTSGNTYNALNTDILNETNEVAFKSANRTQLPAKGRVSRFTTATVNVQGKSVVTSVDVGVMLQETHIVDTGIGWNSTPTSRTSATYARTLVSSRVDHWYARRFYEPEVVLRDKNDPGAFKQLVERISARSPMGVGIRVVTEEGPIDFRFDFPVTGVYASRREAQPLGPSLNERKVVVRQLYYYATDQSGWEVLDRDGSPQDDAAGSKAAKSRPGVEG